MTSEFSRENKANGDLSNPYIQRDNHLIRLAKSGDMDAIAQIYELYQGPILKYIFLRCHNYSFAEQITGDTFVKLVEECASDRGPTTNLRSWLYEVARNKLVDQFRDENSNNRYVKKMSATYNVGNSVSESYEHEDQLALLNRLLNSDLLSGDSKRIIHKRFFGKQSIAAVAKSEEITEVNAKVKQHRGLVKLKDALDHINLT